MRILKAIPSCVKSLHYSILILGPSQFMGSKLGIFGGFGWIRRSNFDRHTRVWKGSKFGFSRFVPVFGLVFDQKGSKFGLFVGFEWVRSSVLVDKPGFE